MSPNSRSTRADRIVGRNIKRRRADRGLSKIEVATSIGCSPVFYDALEDGYVRPDVDMLKALATLFDCRMSDFFENT